MVATVSPVPRAISRIGQLDSNPVRLLDYSVGIAASLCSISATILLARLSSRRRENAPSPPPKHQPSKSPRPAVSFPQSQTASRATQLYDQRAPRARSAE